ncbi:RNA polymerase sigma factor SigX [Tumebacillus permanentifrigoris]|uniref:RNA polymerase sigma factor (Sigma-70 family) n=1 Tax=Tumebacillus permanentifrigoris TaxID=378543 RepID=A0A316D4W2_9BACL|nr:RNA polymerase sigma factor SigX [Tumebacillus permanentifrigoris]PWK07853.1 RNA polymerase sigma factor (sigma-70 family) [Tumebacillus permanentifrigoris]
MEDSVHMVKHPTTRPVAVSSEQSFQDLFRNHYPQVVRRIWSITHDQAVAEDLAQEVFVRLYAVDLPSIENIGAWLTQTSTHVAFNHLRGEKRRVARDAQAADPHSLSEPSTEERWLQHEEIHDVRAALTDLEERDRTLLLLKYSGYDYKELAAITQLETNSIGTLLARARKRFRDLYQQRRGSER